MTTASQMWPIWNLLPTQPVQTGPVAAAWALRLSLLTSLGTMRPCPPLLSLLPPRPTVSRPALSRVPLWPPRCALVRPPLIHRVPTQCEPPGPLSVSPCLFISVSGSLPTSPCLCGSLSMEGAIVLGTPTPGVVGGKFCACTSWGLSPTSLPASSRCPLGCLLPAPPLLSGGRGWSGAGGGWVRAASEGCVDRGMRGRTSAPAAGGRLFVLGFRVELPGCLLLPGPPRGHGCPSSV